MVRVLTVRGSTPSRPSAALATALTILFTSTGSRLPLRLSTCIVVGEAAACGMSATVVSRSWIIVTSVPPLAGAVRGSPPAATPEATGQNFGL